MTTYALLGATGATGSSVLRCLIADPPPDLHRLNILVRSKDKLLQAFPHILSSHTSKLQIHIFEGNSTSATDLIPCLTNPSTIFMCIGQNGSFPGTVLLTSTVTATITALTQLRKQQDSEEKTPSYRPPTILHLRSASLNPPLAAQAPLLVHKTVLFCLHHAYVDLRRACALYPPAADAGLLNYVFIDPPTIHDPRGVTPTGHALLLTGREKQAPTLSYADLGAAMCEVAQRATELGGKAVGVTATGRVREEWGVLVGYLIGGALRRVREWMVMGVPVLYAPMRPFFGVAMSMYGVAL